LQPFLAEVSPAGTGHYQQTRLFIIAPPDSRPYGAPLIPEYWRPVAAFLGMASGAFAKAVPQG
jgi:hypothetical protein